MALLLPLNEIASFQAAAVAAAAAPHRTTRYRAGGGRRDGLAAAATPTPRATARARVTDQEEPRVIRVTDPLRGAVGRPPHLFSIPVLGVSSSSPPPPSPPLWQPPQQQEPESDGGDDRQRYYVNLGYAIRTLREELPEIFNKEPNLDIYRDDIVFKDPLNTFYGIENYKRVFWALRFSGRMFFKALWVDTVSVWQPGENIIMIRWVAHGIPRVPWEARGRFDGTSEYKLDRNGKIYQHRVDNIALNSPPKFRVLQVEELIRSLGCPSTPRPTYFETTASSIISYMPFLMRFTWVRCYLAVHLILVVQCAAKD